MLHFQGVKTYSDPYIFSGGPDPPTPRIYAPAHGTVIEWQVD